MRARSAGRAAAATIAMITAVAALVVPSTSAAAATPATDGLSAQTAAPSCWAVKQSYPSSATGVYWLQTATLVAPQQFYCDMTTDGGGWVLVGRGRNGWSWSALGQGTPNQVRETPTGTGAFSPAALPSSTVDGLLDGGRVDALTDGIRVVRSTNATGTTSQEMRLTPTSLAGWNWAFGAGILTSRVTIDGTSLTGGNTQSWGTDNNYRRLTTTETSAHNYNSGFSFGSNIRSTNTTTQYLWSYTNEGGALPFTQVFIRPKLTSTSFPTIANTGSPASTVRPLMQSTTSNTTPWGVSGVGATVTGGIREVEAIAFVGRTAYVGGGFLRVQKGASPGTDQLVTQPYLAAFDVDTGEWISSFRPVLNGPVWDLQAMPDGNLAVAGEFTNVNGTTYTSGLAELNPTTGAVVDGWRTDVTRPGNTTLFVKTLDLSGGYLYLAGQFTRVSGGNTVGTTVTVGRAARVRVSDGKPDGAWKPNFDGSVVDLDVSDDGTRVYFAGFFDSANGVSNPRLATVTTAAGAATVPGMGPFVPSIGSRQTYQQAIKQVGDTVWAGGSEHILSRYSANDFTRLDSNITRQGGDFQVITVVDGVVYASCHCWNYDYQGTYNWSTPIPNASRASMIRSIGAWDATTGAYIEDFYPSALDGRNGEGGWALEVDPNGCLWFGGDYTRGSWLGSSYQWLGGFGKLCPRDTTAPTTPTNLTSSASGSDTTLTWGASTDAGSFSYEIIRDDRVIATVASNTRRYTLPTPTAATRYFVRAVDATGNRSASTAALVVAPPDASAPTAPTDLTVTGTTSTTVSLVWGPSTDDTGVTGYRVYRDGTDVSGLITSLTYTSTGLAPGSSATYTVRAFDASGNTSPASAGVVGTAAADTTAPSTPAGLAVDAATTTGLHLTWSASTDDVAVAGYRVYRDGSDVSGLVAGTSFSDTGLSAGTAYSYTVKAFDAAGNSSNASTAVTGTTATSGVTPLFTDTWSGADGSAWGSSWATSASNGTVTTQNGAGVLGFSDTSGAYARALLSGVAATADSDVTFSYTWNSTAARSYVDIGLRGSGGWQSGYRQRNGYYVELNSTSSNVVVAKNVNGTSGPLATISNAQTVGTGKQWIRLRVVGSTIQVRTWADGQLEPSTWGYTGTDTSLTTPGQLFLSINRASANTGAKTFTIDDLTLNPATP